MPSLKNIFIKKEQRLLDAEMAANGVAIGDINYASKSKFSRVQLCFIRALLIFMASYGTVGAMVSAFDLPYMVPLVIIGSLIICSYIAFLYYNRITFYVGYILYFFLFTISIFSLYWYVNSGFQAYVNTVYQKYSDHFALTTLRDATEFISDRKLTVSVTMLFIVAFLALLLNITISGYMNLIETFLITFPLMQVGIYIDCKPDAVYLVMLLGVYITVAILGRSSHYRIPDFKNSKKDFAAIRSKNKIVHSYLSDGRSIITTSIFSICLCIIFLISTNAIFYSDLGSQYTKNKLKATTDEYIKMYIQNGMWAFFDRYSSKGGLSNGMLGGVSSVRPDYMTDLVVEFVPMNSNTVYLKAYEGANYSTSLFKPLDTTGQLSANSFCISDFVPANGSEAKVIIENRDAGRLYNYMPYYGTAMGDPTFDEGVLTYEGYYVPAEYVGHMNVPTELLVPASVPSEEYENYAYATYMDTPEYLDEALDEFIYDTDLYYYKNALKGDLTVEQRQQLIIEIAETLRHEYLYNFSYTMAPGATPRNEDFVKYFLLTQKRGYCAHFAASSALVLRRMGIPTKYVEGYMISLTDIMDAEAISTDTTGWIDENAELPPFDTGVISVEVTDGSAHGWTEIYIDGYGWIPYDFTPPSFDEPVSDFSLGSLFSSLLMSRPDDAGYTEEDEDTDNTNGNNKIRYSIGASFGFIIYPMTCIIIFVIILILSIKLARFVSKLLRITRYYERKEYRKAFELYYALFYLYCKKKLSIDDIDMTPALLFDNIAAKALITEEAKQSYAPLINSCLYGYKELDKASYDAAKDILKAVRKAVSKYKKPKEPKRNNKAVKK